MKYFIISAVVLAFLACSATNSTKSDQSTEKDSTVTRKLSEESKNYWSTNGAEISSYRLTQARYGEMREGEAVMVFVTEPFSPSKNTKADQKYADNVSVLKLNFTKRFNTGIYPYSMMNSTFYPMEKGNTSLKISTSVQEWCGHVYMEMQNKGNDLAIQNHSYFEGESFEKTTETASLEDDLWSQVRLHPETIKTGKTKMIPSFFYLRLMHIDAKAYDCSVTQENLNDKTKKLSVNYPELNRTFSVEYDANFPHQIRAWSEKYMDGYGANKKMLETSGQLIKTIRSDYWNKGSNADEKMRTELGLKM